MLLGRGEGFDRSFLDLLSSNKRFLSRFVLLLVLIPFESKSAKNNRDL